MNSYDLEQAKRVFITSDPHFDHTNIIKYCNRPFEDVDEMNNTMVYNWNTTVGCNETVYFLGDMTFGKKSRGAKFWLTQLNGKFIYIKGSHDEGIRPTMQPLENVLEVNIYTTVFVNGLQFFLVHEPEIYSNVTVWMIHGHHHDKRPYLDMEHKRVCVSMELTEYKPISLYDVYMDIIEEERKWN